MQTKSNVKLGGKHNAKNLVLNLAQTTLSLMSTREIHGV